MPTRLPQRRAGGCRHPAPFLRTRVPRLGTGLITGAPERRRGFLGTVVFQREVTGTGDGGCRKARRKGKPAPGVRLEVPARASGVHGRQSRQKYQALGGTLSAARGPEAQRVGALAQPPLPGSAPAAVGASPRPPCREPAVCATGRRAGRAQCTFPSASRRLLGAACDPATVS